jgi:hypothetical protein
MRHNIALIGPMGSGKSYLASLLRNYDYHVLSFGDNVKKLVANMLTEADRMIVPPPVPWTLERVNAEKHNPQIRKLIQFVGDEIGRGYYGENTWIELLKQDMRTTSYFNPRTVFVVDDCRYKNEVHFLKTMGFMTIRIVRPEEDRKKFLAQQIYLQRPDLKWTTEEGVYKRADKTVQAANLLLEVMSHTSEGQITHYNADYTIHLNDEIDALTAASRIALGKLNLLEEFHGERIST